MRRWWRHSVSACRSSPRPRRTSTWPSCSPIGAPTCSPHRSSTSHRRRRRTRHRREFGFARVRAQDAPPSATHRRCRRDRRRRASVDSPCSPKVPTQRSVVGHQEGRLQGPGRADAGHLLRPDQPGAGGEAARRRQAARGQATAQPCPGEPRTGERRADAQPAARGVDRLSASAESAIKAATPVVPKKAKKAPAPKPAPQVTDNMPQYVPPPAPHWTPAPQQQQAPEPRQALQPKPAPQRPHQGGGHQPRPPITILPN